MKEEFLLDEPSKTETLFQTNTTKLKSDVLNLDILKPNALELDTLRKNRTKENVRICENLIIFDEQYREY